LDTVTGQYKVGVIPAYDGHTLVYALDDNLFPVLSIYIIDLYFNEEMILVRCFRNPDIGTYYVYQSVAVGYTTDNSGVRDLSQEEYQEMIMENSFTGIMHFNDFE